MQNKMLVSAAALSNAAQIAAKSMKGTFGDLVMASLNISIMAEAAEQIARNGLRDHWGMTDDELTVRLQQIEAANGWDGLLAGTVWQYVLQGYEFNKDGKLKPYELPLFASRFGFSSQCGSITDKND